MVSISRQQLSNIFVVSDGKTTRNHNNSLITSRTNPRLSAYAKIFGQFYFNAMPMEPPRTKITAHKNPAQRATWIKHGVAVWYIGPEF